MQKIVITGMGAVTPVGIGVNEYWNNLISGKSGIDFITRFDTTDFPIKIAAQVKDFVAEDHMPKRLAKDSALFAKYAYAAASEALAQSGLDCEAESSRIGITMATAMNGILETAQAQNDVTTSGDCRVSPKFVPKILGNMAAAQIAIDKHIMGPSLTVTTACSSGADAIKLAKLLLDAGEADAVLAVGGESSICPLVMSSLASAKALSRSEDPSSACCPFDDARSGFIMGEGGGALVLETEEHALARGAEILGVLLAASNNNDAYHITSPAADAHGAIACMKDAIAQSGLEPSDIGYINAHGTSTHAGDIAEALAVRTVFGENSPAVSSTKSSTGHMMGAGGITEVITCLMACREGLLPHTLNLNSPSEEFDGVDLVKGEPRRVAIKAAMSNAFGFGGQNSTIIVSDYNK